jgi:hypothetical protein
MPLPNILSGKTKRCKAKCKARGDQCRNPAAYGMAVCRYHGARKPETIMRGANHPQHRHGRETIEAKAERSQRLAELRDLEAMMFGWGIASGAKWRGRKPRAQHSSHSHHKADKDRLIKLTVRHYN